MSIARDQLIDHGLRALHQGMRADRNAIRAGLVSTLPAAGALDRERLRWVLKADRAELWRTEGARSTAAFLSALFHISNWKARRWIGAAHALEKLPLTAAALENGSLSLDKVCELTRFATAQTEKKLITWARRVTMATIRERGDEAVRRTLLEAERIEKHRYFRPSVGEDHVAIEGVLPLDQGTALMQAVDELAHALPRHPDETDGTEEESSIEQRRADALVLLATSRDGDSVPQAAVVLHAPLEALAGGDGGCTFENGGVLHPETARRIACDARLQVVLEGKDGDPLGIGRTSQIAPSWLRRAVFKRDHNTCSFPGCEMKRFLTPHHIRHWTRDKGPTDLTNLVTVCSFHHKLLHEYGWDVALDAAQQAVWYRPGRVIYDPGPAPPQVAAVRPVDPPGPAERFAQMSRWVGRLHPAGRDPDDRSDVRVRWLRERLIPEWAK